MFTTYSRDIEEDLLQLHVRSPEAKAHTIATCANGLGGELLRLFLDILGIRLEKHTAGFTAACNDTHNFEMIQAEAEWAKRSQELRKSERALSG